MAIVEYRGICKRVDCKECHVSINLCGANKNHFNNNGALQQIAELDARDGSQTEQAVFDLNYDGKLDNADNATGGTPLNGWKLPGIATSPTVIATDSVDIKVMSTSTGSLELRQEAAPDQDGRQSWRQVK